MKRAASGFTLMEVLVATVLLASGLALAFATLRSATALVNRGEILAERNERIRAVQQFMRNHLTSALPVAFATDPATLQQSRFIGEAQRVRFVADLPDYLGRGGPYLYDVRAGDDGRLLVEFAMVQAGTTVRESPPRAPDTLAGDLRQVRFRYRGLGADNALGPWQDQWQAADQLPLQVAMQVQSADGQWWPEMVVTLARSEGGGGAGAALPPQERR
ncbi:prepilin-type N-terminal cleavage/methylation domain-containing protein [Pseudoxanthomonas mexicana]|uniref:prepilin-type N-terminal cleavage/methylation domain-containing protein n=1 Tax=Pseudoxanthomonas mexicana TaxID=128785 RepID=UPI00398B72EA